MLVFFVGMPGSGKTSLGRYMADGLNLPFFDTDILIEEQEGLSVSEIFTRKGESYFRNLETQIVKDWNIKDGIIATGGGMVCHDNIIRYLNKRGVTIYVRTPLDILVKRIHTSADRPMFYSANKEILEKKLQHLFEERHQYYEKALILIDNSKDMASALEQINSKLSGYYV